MKNITLGDIVLAFICVVFAIVIIASNLFTIGGVSYKWYALLGWAAFSIVLFMPIDEGLRLYGSVILILRFMAFPRKYIQGGKGNKSIAFKLVLRSPEKTFTDVESDKIISKVKDGLERELGITIRS